MKSALDINHIDHSGRFSILNHDNHFQHKYFKFISIPKNSLLYLFGVSQYIFHICTQT